MIQKHQTGYLPTPKSVRNAEQQLKKMVAVTTWCVKTNLANPIFAGYVWDLGSRMDLHGITATDMMKMKLDQLVKVKKNQGLRYKDTFSTATAI